MSSYNMHYAAIGINATTNGSDSEAIQILQIEESSTNYFGNSKGYRSRPTGTDPFLGDPEIDDFIPQLLEAVIGLNDLEERRRKNIIVPEVKSERTSPCLNWAGFLRSGEIFPTVENDYWKRSV